LVPLLPLLPNGFSLTTTLTVAGLLEGWRTEWLPVAYTPRHGRSRFRPVRDTLRLLLSLLRAVAYFAPLRLFLPAAAATGLAAAAFLAWDVAVERNLTDKTVLTVLTTLEILLLGFLADLVARAVRRGGHTGS
ncbi:MAG: glycosyltransferase family 2 protein, partial [Nitrospirae bacterium]